MQALHTHKPTTTTTQVITPDNFFQAVATMAAQEPTVVDAAAATTAISAQNSGEVIAPPAVLHGHPQSLGVDHRLLMDTHSSESDWLTNMAANAVQEGAEENAGGVEPNNQEDGADDDANAMQHAADAVVDSNTMISGGQYESIPAPTTAAIPTPPSSGVPHDSSSSLHGEDAHTPSRIPQWTPAVHAAVHAAVQEDTVEGNDTPVLIYATTQDISAPETPVVVNALVNTAADLEVNTWPGDMNNTWSTTDAAYTAKDVDFVDETSLLHTFDEDWTTTATATTTTVTTTHPHVEEQVGGLLEEQLQAASAAIMDKHSVASLDSNVQRAASGLEWDEEETQQERGNGCAAQHDGKTTACDGSTLLRILPTASVRRMQETQARQGEEGL